MGRGAGRPNGVHSGIDQQPVRGNLTDLVRWSLMDGLSPTVSKLGLRVLYPFIPELISP